MDAVHRLGSELLAVGREIGGGVGLFALMHHPPGGLVARIEALEKGSLAEWRAPVGAVVVVAVPGRDHLLHLRRRQLAEMWMGEEMLAAAAGCGHEAGHGVVEARSILAVRLEDRALRADPVGEVAVNGIAEVFCNGGIVAVLSLDREIHKPVLSVPTNPVRITPAHGAVRTIGAFAADRFVDDPAHGLFLFLVHVHGRHVIGETEMSLAGNPVHAAPEIAGHRILGVGVLGARILHVDERLAELVIIHQGVGGFFTQFLVSGDQCIEADRVQVPRPVGHMGRVNADLRELLEKMVPVAALIAIVWKGQPLQIPGGELGEHLAAIRLRIEQGFLENDSCGDPLRRVLEPLFDGGNILRREKNAGVDAGLRHFRSDHRLVHRREVVGRHGDFLPFGLRAFEKCDLLGGGKFCPMVDLLQPFDFFAPPGGVGEFLGSVPRHGPTGNSIPGKSPTGDRQRGDGGKEDGGDFRVLDHGR